MKKIGNKGFRRFLYVTNSTQHLFKTNNLKLSINFKPKLTRVKIAENKQSKILFIFFTLGYRLPCFCVDNLTISTQKQDKFRFRNNLSDEKWP